MGEEWAVTLPSLGTVSAFPKLLSAVGHKNGAQVLAENERAPVLHAKNLGGCVLKQ